MSAEVSTPRETLYGDFSSIFKEDGKWTVGVHKLPEDAVWTFNEPDAVVIIQRDSLLVRVEPLTRKHDTIQILDNFKHVYTSRTRFQAPLEGPISFGLQMDAKTEGAKENDLYDGSAAFRISDPESGLGFGFITNGLEYATLYSRLTPSGDTPKTAYFPRFFEIYEEHPLSRLAEGLHIFTVSYHKKKEYAEWLLDGQQVKHQEWIPDTINSFHIDVGIMTGVDLGTEGSRSIQGQSVKGEWGRVKIQGLLAQN